VRIEEYRSATTGRVRGHATLRLAHPCCSTARCGPDGKSSRRTRLRLRGGSSPGDRRIPASDDPWANRPDIGARNAELLEVARFSSAHSVPSVRDTGASVQPGWYLAVVPASSGPVEFRRGLSDAKLIDSQGRLSAKAGELTRCPKLLTSIGLDEGPRGRDSQVGHGAESRRRIVRPARRRGSSALGRHAADHVEHIAVSGSRVERLADPAST